MAYYSETFIRVKFLSSQAWGGMAVAQRGLSAVYEDVSSRTNVVLNIHDGFGRLSNARYEHDGLYIDGSTIYTCGSNLIVRDTTRFSHRIGRLNFKGLVNVSGTNYLVEVDSGYSQLYSYTLSGRSDLNIQNAGYFSGVEVNDITHDGDDFIGITSSGVVRMDTTTGTVETIASIVNPLGVAFYQNQLYVLTSNILYRLPQGPPPAPGVPTNTSATRPNAQSKTVNVSWNAVSGTSYYQVKVDDAITPVPNTPLSLIHI